MDIESAKLLGAELQYLELLDQELELVPFSQLL